MAKFRAKNKNQSSFYQAVYRSRYKKQAFPENNGRGPRGVVDFLFAERNFYGRIDQNLNIVVPKIEKLKRISSRDDPNGVVAMNFVIDQFDQFMRTYERALNSRKIRQDDPYLSNIQVYRSYQNPKNLYDIYFSEIMQNFENIFLNKEEAMNPKNYYKQFLNYIDQITPTFPLTYTAWQRSKESSIFTSGLALDIAGLGFGNDSLKETFIESENFPYFLNACNNFGFSVVKNSPWVMVSDLASPSSTLYHENYGLSSIRQIFSENYLQTNSFDIEYLKDNLFNSYNNFVSKFAYKKEIRVCNSNKTIKNNIYRSNIDIIEFNNIFNNNYFIEYYNNIRYFEEESGFSISDRNKFTRNAKKLQKTFDNFRAISYINEQYRSVYKNKPGGLNSILKRIEDKDKPPEEMQTSTSTTMPRGSSGGSGGSSSY